MEAWLRRLLWLSVLVTLGAGALLSYVLMARWLAGPPVAPPRISFRSLRVLVLRADETDAYFRSVPGARSEAYGEKITFWKERLRRTGYGVEVVSSDSLARGLSRLTERGTGVPVIVAPSAAALSDEALAAVLHAVKRGTGLVATWQFALRRADGSWRGYRPLARLVEVRPLSDGEELPPGSLRYLAPHAANPITAGLPTGARLEFQAFDPPLVVGSPAAVADWVRWEIRPFGPPASPLYPAAVARRRYGLGRVVWLDFDPRSLIPAGESPLWLDLLLDNAVRWAAGHPIGAIETWPRGARMAAVVGLDTEHQFQAARAVARQFAEAGVPLTAFLVSRLAEQDPRTVAALARAGEIASHTHEHRVLAGRDADSQTRELSRSRDLLARLSGQRIVGLRPPEEKTDASTLSASVKAGYVYVAGLASKDRVEPWIVRVDGSDLVALPRIPHDDYEIVIRDGIADPVAAWTLMRRDLDYLYRLGGLYFFDFHTQFAARPAVREGVRHLMGLALKPVVWMTTGREIAEWWRRRAGASIRVESPGLARIAVTVAAREAIEELGVIIYPPDGIHRVRVLPERGSPPALSHLGGDDHALRLEYTSLRAGETRQTHLDLR